MQTYNQSPKHPFSYYGKKDYYVNRLTADFYIPIKKEPEYFHENIEGDDTDHKPQDCH